jgi:hypothetical protein
MFGHHNHMVILVTYRELEGWEYSRMRVNLITEPASRTNLGKGKFPLSLTIRPASGFPGEYQFPTDRETLMRLLRQETDLPAHMLERFDGKLVTKVSARLLGVELGDSVLTEIGYFID